MQPTDSKTYPFFQILGVKVNELTLDGIQAVMDEWIRTGKQDYIVLTGAHGIIEMQDDPNLKEINNQAGLVTPDGMPNVWLGRAKGYRDIEKVTGSDIMEGSFKRSAERGYRHFFYGGKEGVADKLKMILEEKYPGIQIVGTYCPPFRPLSIQEHDEVVEQINGSGADIVWCGLGCPKQERWMHEFRPLLDAPVLIGVGAGFDFFTGEVPRAPYWIRNSGFEWFYRTLKDPRRLIKRYGKVVPRFIYLNIFEALTGKFFKNTI